MIRFEMMRRLSGLRKPWSGLNLKRMSLMRPQMWVAYLAISWPLCAAPARAGLAISLESTTVAQGGTGTLNVFLTSNASANTPDMINEYAFQLQIVNNGTNNSQLAFAANQGFGYLSNAGPNPAYVFLGNSLDAEPPPSAVGAASTTVYPGDTFNGQDATADNNPASLSSGTNYLLASLTVTTQTDAAPTVGDSFTVSLEPESGTGSFNDNPFTYFDNFNVNTGSEDSATPFTSTPATVTITAVPEPTSIVLGLIGILVIAAYYQPSRRLRIARGNLGGHRSTPIGLLTISWSRDNGSQVFVDSVDEGSGRSSSIGTYLSQIAANSAGAW